MGASLQSVRGFKDILPPDSGRTVALENLAREVLELYGFLEIRLPTLELAELFIKATGETTDIVEKEMFQLEDQGGRHLALRPEGTPGVVRAFLQDSMSQKRRVSKLYYVGSMFRAERPQAGRFREFEQIGAECLGSASPTADVEVILALNAIFDRAGLKGKTRLRLNNIGCDEFPSCRPKYRGRLLEFLQKNSAQLCANCQRRMTRNPLRVLDCKTDGPKLAGAPKLEPCQDCTDHFAQVGLILAKNGFPGIAADTTLVRGLDYYTRTVFEFQSSNVGAQDAIAGGGRYDGLVESMGGPKTPATGWALGVERTLAAILATNASNFVSSPRSTTLVYIAVPGGQPSSNDAHRASREGARLLQELRSLGIRAEGSLFGRKLDVQLQEAAERLKARFAVILGDRELANHTCVLKDLSDRSQEEVRISDLPEKLRALIARISPEAQPR